MPGRRFTVILAVTVLAAAVLRLAWIGGQAPTPDDTFVAWTAHNYVAHGQPNPTMPFHPVLRNLLVDASMRVFGGSALGVKGFSLLFGILLVAVTGLFVRRAARDDRAGLIAAALVAVDIVQIDFSRQAIQEVHAAFFAMLGAWLAVEALRGEDTHRWRWLLPFAGVSFGLGVASKFYVIPALLLSMVLLIWSAWKRREPENVLLTVSSLGLLSFLVYLLTYIPWFGRGYGLGEWVRFQAAVIVTMVKHTRPAYAYLAYNKPSLWFIRPFYGYADPAITTAGRVQLTIAVGNPFVWLAVLPATVYSLIKRPQLRRGALLLAFFLAAYAPLALSKRPIWLLSSVAVFPFAAGVLGSVVSALSRRYGMRVIRVYGSAVLVTSLLLYPLAIGRSLEFSYLRPVVAEMGDYQHPFGPPGQE
ncbi:MAG: phospholipid carrier-dependent glycosyltransferase [Coriobacteriia bacterium]